MAKQLSGIDVYKKMKDMKASGSPTAASEPGSAGFGQPQTARQPSAASAQARKAVPPAASAAAAERAAAGGRAAAAERGATPQAARAVFSELKPAPGQQVFDSQPAGATLDLKKLREEVHSNVESRGFAPDRNPAYFDRNESAGLVKQGLEVKGVRKAAKFLMLLGQERAGAVLNQLTSAEVADILREMETLPPVGADEALVILREFKNIKDRIIDPHGGVDTARTILENALGVEKGRSFLQKAVPDAVEKPFSFLADADVTQLFLLLKKESPDVIALIIPNLPKKTASELLKSFSEQMQIDIVRKMAHRKKPSAMALTIVEERLQNNFRKIGQVKTDPVDGSGALANILKYVSPQLESEIIEELRSEDPLLSRDVKDKLLTIDMILNINQPDLQKVLQEYNDVDLAVILKGKSREIENKIYGAVSERRAAIIRYERELLGPMKREDVEKATKAFLHHIRKLQLQGEVRIYDPNENYV